MKFCEKCGNLLRAKTVSNESFLLCIKCGTKVKSNESLLIGSMKGEENDKIIIVDDIEKNTFPVTQIMCPKCDELRQAEWTMQQTRGGDEPPTRFYQCKTCNWRWREYS